MRIRTIGFLLTASIAVITLSGMAALYNQQRSRLARLDEAESLVKVIGHVSRFVEALALERGAYNQILISAETRPEQIEALVGPRVTMTDGIFVDTEEALSALPSKLEFPGFCGHELGALRCCFEFLRADASEVSVASYGIVE